MRDLHANLRIFQPQTTKYAGKQYDLYGAYFAWLVFPWGQHRQKEKHSWEQSMVYLQLKMNWHFNSNAAIPLKRLSVPPACLTWAMEYSWRPKMQSVGKSGLFSLVSPLTTTCFYGSMKYQNLLSRVLKKRTGAFSKHSPDQENPNTLSSEFFIPVYSVLFPNKYVLAFINLYAMLQKIKINIYYIKLT